jgi:hypothetical protein
VPIVTRARTGRPAAVTSEQAFRMLISSSQATNMKLVEVARWLTETGDHSPDEMGWRSTSDEGQAQGVTCRPVALLTG